LVTLCRKKKIPTIGDFLFAVNEFFSTVNYEMPSQDFFLILSENSIEFFIVAKGYDKKLLRICSQN